MSIDRGAARPAEPRYFTLDGYGRILERAIAIGYRVATFRDFEQHDETPVLLLRHDLDHGLGGVEQVLELEASLGVRATWFVQVACDFYNLLSPSGRAFLTRLTDLGHEVGLHYEAPRYAGDDGDTRLRDDVRLLESLCGEPVVSAAQHLPVDQEPVDVLGVVRNEAYEARFIEPPMHYISDSLMAWRQATPHDLLDEGVSFQFLTHPETWLGRGGDMFQTLAAMRDGESQEIQRRYDALIEYYRELLETRASRDRVFRERRKS